jgi:hypothetical protein
VHLLDERVSIGPGATAFTRTPRRANSIAITIVMAITPSFEPYDLIRSQQEISSSMAAALPTP